MFFERSQLSNGIRVLSEKISNVRSVSLGFWIKLGSRDESDSVRGSTHFLEHLMFKGTQKRSSMDISEAFDSLGAEFNAFSAKENTCFYSRLLDEHLEVGLEVISDMLQNPLLKNEDIEAERKVILEEIHMHEDLPDEQIHDLFLGAIWPDHPLGKPVIGSSQSVSDMKYEQLRSIYEDAYKPDHIVISAAGDIEHQRVIDLVQKHFTAKGKGMITRKETPPKPSHNLSVLKRPSEQAHISLGFQTMHAHDPQRFALFILDTVIGGGMSSRLFQEIREKRSLAYSVFSHHGLYAETGFFGVYAGCSPANVRQVVEQIIEELMKAAQFGITKAEYKRGQEHIKGSLILSLESTSHRMGRLGKAEILHGEILSLDEIIDRVNNTTLEEVNDLARVLFDPKKMALAAVGPFEESQFDFFQKQA